MMRKISIIFERALKPADRKSRVELVTVENGEAMLNTLSWMRAGRTPPDVVIST